MVFLITACDHCYPRAFFFMKGARSGSARANSSSQGFYFLANLDRGVPVSTGEFGSVANMPAQGILLSYLGEGNFGDTGTGVIGLKFDTGRDPIWMGSN